MAWGEVKVEQKREEFILAYLDQAMPFAELCRLFEISRKCGYKRVERFVSGNLEDFKDRSSKPLKQPFSYNQKVVDAVINMRVKYSKLGPRKLLVKLRESKQDIQWPSTTTIGNILDRNGLTIPRKLRLKVPPRTAPFEQCHQANDLWCTDFKGWFFTGDQQRCEPFTLTDAHTRFILRCAHLNKNTENLVWGILATAFMEYGLPKYIRHDNGTPFATRGPGRLSKLSVKLIKAGVIPEWIDPGQPHQNSRHERMHLTLKQDTAQPPADSLKEQMKRMKEFVDYYNFERPHEGLGQKYPGDFYAPSQRSWNGKLESPEYPYPYEVRMVRTCGKITWKCKGLTIGTALTGEPVGIKEREDGQHDVYYGPILLGLIDQAGQFKKPDRRAGEGNE